MAVGLRRFSDFLKFVTDFIFYTFHIVYLLQQGRRQDQEPDHCELQRGEAVWGHIQDQQDHQASHQRHSHQVLL